MEHLKRASTIFDREGESAKQYRAQTDFMIGKHYIAARKHVEATESLNSSLAIYKEIAPSASITLTNHAFLIEAYEERGMSEEATKHCLAIGAAKPHDPDQEYKPVYYVQPRSPSRAMGAGRSGHVIVELTVDENGFVRNPTVLEYKGHQTFKGAALDAVAKFRFAPRYENGAPVETEGVKYRFNFALAN